MNRLIKSKDHLCDIIRKYGTRGFTDVRINDKLIELLIQRIVSGDGKWKNDCEFLKSFAQQFYDDFGTEHFDIVKSSPKIGSYSVVFDSSKNYDMIVKVIRNTRDTNNGLSFSYKTILHNEAFHAYVQEFTTYIILMSLIMYLDDNALINPDKPDNDSFTPLISKIFVKIAKPLMKKQGTDDDVQYVFGYMMEKYDFSCGELLAMFRESITDPSIDVGPIDDESVLETLERIYRIIQSINRLKKYGIIISHRDLTGNNIMLRYAGDTDSEYSFSEDEDPYPADIGLIDFGFIGIKIQMIDNNDWSTGYFFDPVYSTDIRSNYDTIFFTLYLIIYQSTVTQRIKIFRDLMEGIDYKKNKSRITIKKDKNNRKKIKQTDIWLYPYVTDYADEEIILDRIIKIIRFEKRVRCLYTHIPVSRKKSINASHKTKPDTKPDTKPEIKKPNPDGSGPKDSGPKDSGAKDSG